jgi:glycosyltransferase involved in cell wall biosynthesis
MSAAPAVSIILPTYNRAALLPRAIASVLGQGYRNFELIVVDDGSSDGTEAVMRRFDDSRLIYLPPERNLGDAGARMRGIARARGVWLAFQDSDDEWLPGRLGLQMDYAASLGADFALVGGTLLRYVGGPVERIGWPMAETGAVRGEVDRQRFIAGFCAYLQSLLVRRTVYEELGGFDTSLKARSDFEFCLRVAQRYRVAAVQDPVVLSYETPEGISLRADYRYADIGRVLQKHHEALATVPGALDFYYYHYAKAAFEVRDNRRGREYVRKALRLNPLRPYGWVMLSAGLLGGDAVWRLVRLNHALSQALRRAG